MLVQEQNDTIFALQTENEATKTELSESIVNHAQQSQLLNVIEISGLENSTKKKITETVMEIRLRWM